MKPGRNDSCVCGSGKKYKKCCQEKLEANSRQPVVQTKPAGLASNDAEAHFNLATLHYAQGKFMLALNSIIQSLKIREEPASKSFFVTCVKQKQFGEGAAFVRQNMVRALTEPWGIPAELAETSAMLIKANPVIEKCAILAIKSAQKRLSAQDLLSQVGLANIAEDKLLRTLMCNTAVCDIDLERLLTTCREVLLDAAVTQQSPVADTTNMLDFYSALARQCFINEYVFAQSEDETRKVNMLREKLIEALEAKIPIPPISVIAVAAYFPLYALPHAEKFLAGPWAEAVQAVLTQQVSEPLQELQERAGIPRLTNIDDEVSLLVQTQYEENPYPRWVKLAPAANAMTVDDKVRQLFPLVSFNPMGDCTKPEVLVAGCGTGSHSINVTQKFIGARTLAIDLSLSSLSYAKRKTREMGLNSIEYAQADIMKLGSLERRFDFIESCGVLHHLADPWAGWRILLPLLRPGGFMKLGFYSELARREIVRTRAFIAEQGYGSSHEEIRRCRQDMMAARGTGNFAGIFRITDFYSTSECRDLLFHVQEHRMTIPEIEAFLRENDLAFLGFEIRADFLQAYKRRFPDDQAAINLAQWHTFERENPHTFIGMYNFWVQKAA